jgi:gamma-glutamyltranspeptidase / glutathione hydrolase
MSVTDELPALDPSVTGLGVSVFRPPFRARRAMISACHYLASVAGFRILQAGGNAADAGVAAGLAINVVQPNLTSLGGVAPIMWASASGELATIDGLGV